MQAAGLWVEGRADSEETQKNFWGWYNNPYVSDLINDAAKMVTFIIHKLHLSKPDLKKKRKERVSQNQPLQAISALLLSSCVTTCWPLNFSELSFHFYKMGVTAPLPHQVVRIK